VGQHDFHDFHDFHRGVVIGSALWETVDMPKANLRALRGAQLQEFVCTVCKTRFSYSGSLADRKSQTELKLAVTKDWDTHLFATHRRQWDAEQEKKAKRASQAKSAAK
jgi:hypothetical protein